jgi:glycosyltransferase involved in cell wall biosynthesis
VAQILQEVDFGLLSSRSESGPITLLEYIASSLPFVVTQTGQITETVRSKGIGFFVPPGDTEAYASALEQLINLSEEERRRIGRQGRQIAADCFSIERQVDQLVRLYAELGVGGRGQLV